MAYITTEQVRGFRNELNKYFPTKHGWKLSITKEHYSSININILKAPVDLRGISQISEYYISEHFADRPKIAEVLLTIRNICMKGNHDNSDAMTDYFDVGWYFNLRVGRYDKEFEFQEDKNENWYKIWRENAQIEVCARETKTEAGEILKQENEK